MASRSAPSGPWRCGSKASEAGLGTSTELAIPGPSLETRCGALDWGAPERRGVEARGLRAHRRMDELLRLAEDPDAWAALATLIAMEVVLGLDNLVFIALLTNRIDERRRGLARKLGLSLALVFRLALLASASWVVHFTEPLGTVLGRSFSIRDLLLLAGGLFLVWKATTEIHHRVDPDGDADGAKALSPLSLAAGLIQIVLIDIVFSVDSIITAVGMTDHFPIMVVAVVVSVGVMMA